MWAIFDTSYFVDPYIAPVLVAVSGDVAVPEGARLFGCAPFGDWYTLPPGLLILGLPAGFRLTCYYYRKAYYRSLLAVAAGVRGARAAQASTPVRRASR